MAGYTQINQQTIDGILSLYGRNHAIEWHAMTHGISNSNFRVVTSDNEELLLKVSNDKSREELEAEQSLLLWLKEQNFFSLDVRQVKQELEQLALIKSVQIKKVWPDTLLVKFKEDIPVAVWNNDSLLNPLGEELVLPSSFDQSRLPRLSGPEQMTAQVMRQFQRFQSRLSEVDAAMIRLSMNTIGSWEIELENGWTIRLGRQQLEQRVERLIELLKILPQEKVAVVDLRYGKGAAIKWLPA